MRSDVYTRYSQTLSDKSKFLAPTKRYRLQYCATTCLSYFDKMSLYTRAIRRFAASASSQSSALIAAFGRRVTEIQVVRVDPWYQ